MSLRVACSLLAAGLLAGVCANLRADDDLSRFVEKNRLLAQKVKTEAKYAMAQARVLQKADPEQARSVLLGALKQVQNSTALSASEQTQLSGQLLSRLREIGEIIRHQKVTQEQAPLKQLPPRPTERPRTDPVTWRRNSSKRAEPVLPRGRASSRSATRALPAHSTASRRRRCR